MERAPAVREQRALGAGGGGRRQPIDRQRQRQRAGLAGGDPLVMDYVEHAMDVE